MTVLQVTVLLVVALGAAGVALTRDPWRQVVVLGIFGLALAILFMVFQAPDVALSEIVVSTVGLPVMVLLALRKVADQQRDQDRRSRDET